MTTFFKELFEYNHHFNQAMIGLAISGQTVFSERGILLLNHIINAHEIWNIRILGQIPQCGVWEIRSMDSWVTNNEKNFKQSVQILDTFSLSDMVSYQNSKGTQFTNSVRDILFHIINHSTHHRAQLATDLRNNGLVPPVQDYIFYKR